MALSPLGVSISNKYTLTGPDGTVATFNDPTDANFVGYVTEPTGLDSPEVRDNGESIAGMDGGIHGAFYYGRRPITITGKMINLVSAEDRNRKITKLQQACNAMRSDAILSWTPDGGEPVYVAVRRQGPLRITGNWEKQFQILLVSSDARIYSVATTTESLEPKNAASSTTGTLPIGSVASPDGKHVYILNQTSVTVGVYSRNKTNGALTLVESKATTEIVSPTVIAISPDGKGVYVGGTEGVMKFSRNESTGALTKIGTLTASGVVRALEVSSGAGKYVCVAIAKEIKLFIRTVTTQELNLKEGISGAWTEEACIAASPGVEKYFFVASAKNSSVRRWDVQGSFLSTLNTTQNKNTMITATYDGIHTKVLMATQAGNVEYFTDIENISGEFSLLEVGKIEATKISSIESFLETNIKLIATDESKNAISVLELKGPTLELRSKYITEGKPTSCTYIASGVTSVYITCVTTKTVMEYTYAKSSLNRRGSSTMTVVNRGSMETFPVFTVSVEGSGELNELTMTNVATGQSLVFSGAFLSGQEYTIDTLNRVITNKGLSTYALLNSTASVWWALQPGTTEVSISAANITGANKVSIAFKSAWI